MCRAKDLENRRCPCDTSEARRLRRQNAAARSSYSALATKPVEEKTLPVVVPEAPYTVESVKEDIAILQGLGAELRDSGADSTEIFTAYDKKINAIGSGVEYLAETKYGAPKDEEMKTAIELATLKAEADADDRKNEARNKRALLEIEEDRLKQALLVHADATTHPVMKERWAVWEEKDPETFAAWKAKETEIGEAQRAIYGSHSRIQDDINAVRKEMLEKRNAAMKAALEEVGVQFADPESIQYSDDSHKDAVKSLKNALSYYPQEWVDASNRMHHQRPLRIKRSQGRAHYSANKEQRTMTSRTRAWITMKPEDWTPDPHDRNDSEYIDLNGADGWTDPKSGIVHEVWQQGNGKKAWLSVSYDYYDKSGTPPKSGAWEKVELYEEKYVPGEGFVRTGELITHYRKPSVRRSSSYSSYKAELTVTKDSQVFVGDDPGMRVALHEFAHRVENTTPIVTGYEDAFLKRRAGHLPVEGQTVEPEKLTRIYSGKKEVGFKDNFATHYMGKVYSGSSYKEILSMGMESLFAGTNGGFAGMGNHKADADYKKFILGVLASSAKK